MNTKRSRTIILLSIHIVGMCLICFLCYILVLHPAAAYVQEYTQTQNKANIDPSSAATFTQMLEDARSAKYNPEPEAPPPVEEAPAVDPNPVIPKSSITSPSQTNAFATINIERIGMSVPLYYGDTSALLRKGAGQYTGDGSSTFGEGKQIIVAGHNTSYFKPLQNAVVGDLVKVTTDYGEFAYSIVRIEVHDMNDTSSYNLNLDHEQLVLYTCYPFSGPPGKTQRYFCYCDKLYGPTLTE